SSPPGALRAPAGTARLVRRHGRPGGDFRRPDQDHRGGASLASGSAALPFDLHPSAALSGSSRLHVFRRRRADVCSSCDHVCGSLLAAWNPRAALALVGSFAFASYLDNELATIYKLPAWVHDLSAFKLFGTPLLTGVDNRSLALMLLLALAGLGSSILVMQRRDVGA